jgi:hypothetical protein
MRSAVASLFGVAIIVVAGYAGLVWLDSTMTLDVAPRPQPAAMSSNENVQSELVATAREASRSAATNQNVPSREAASAELTSSATRGDEGLEESKSAITSSSAGQGGSDQSKATASSGDREANDPPAGGCMPIGVTSSGTLVFPVQCRDLLARYGGGAPDARPDSTPATLAEPANHDHQAPVNQDHEAVDSARDQQIEKFPSTPSPVHPPPQARAKASRPVDVQQFSYSRNDRRSHQRFARLLKDPLTLSCMACLLVGP